MRNLTKSAQALSNKATKTFVEAIDKVEKSNLLLQQAIEQDKDKNSKDVQKINEAQERISFRESENEERKNMITNNNSFIENLKNIIK